MRLRCRPGKTILLRYPKNTGMIKNHSTMMPENIEKTMYLSRDEVKITVLWYPKKDFFLIFCLKSHYFDAQKYWCPKKLKKKTCTFKTWSNKLGFSWYQNWLLDAQNKLPHTILRLQETQNRLPEANSWLIHVKTWYFDAQKNIF